METLKKTLKKKLILYLKTLLEHEVMCTERENIHYNQYKIRVVLLFKWKKRTYIYMDNEWGTYFSIYLFIYLSIYLFSTNNNSLFIHFIALIYFFYKGQGHQ